MEKGLIIVGKVQEVKNKLSYWMAVEKVYPGTKVIELIGTSNKRISLVGNK